ncbi:hypothetical protein [Aliarcobacter butzleri]|uniref:hypothetical protein n=1 Tax=Aliarcobacter butzleri TaxID=28197 RepID=UPI003AFB4183
MLNKEWDFLPDGISAINIKNPFQTTDNFENIFDIVQYLPTWKDIEYLKKIQNCQLF